MPTLTKQNTYLFNSCKDLYIRGLSKARGVDPTRVAAFAAGYADGMTTLVREMIQRGHFEPSLQEAYEAGVQAAVSAFQPPKWSLGPYTQQEPDPLEEEALVE